MPGVDSAVLQEQITAGLQSDAFMWLPVNFGDGRATPALLLISPATPVAIMTEGDPEDQEAGDDAIARYVLEPEGLPVSRSRRRPPRVVTSTAAAIGRKTAPAHAVDPGQHLRHARCQK